MGENQHLKRNGKYCNHPSFLHENLHCWKKKNAWFPLDSCYRWQQELSCYVWALSIVLNFNNKTTCIYFGLIKECLVRNWVVAQNGHVWVKDWAPGRDGPGALGSWSQDLSHTGPSVPLPGPGWKTCPELLCVWKEHREITAFTFWLSL